MPWIRLEHPSVGCYFCGVWTDCAWAYRTGGVWVCEGCRAERRRER